MAEVAYKREIELKDFKCFRGKHKFSFADEEGKWYRWTVFLGNNNTGKTSLLKDIVWKDSFISSTYGYGIIRSLSSERIKYYTSDGGDKVFANLLHNTPLINFEDWLLDLDYAAKGDREMAAQMAAQRKDLLENLIISDVLPEIEDIRFGTDEKLTNYVEYKSKDKWCQLAELGYGYQSTLAWMMDFCYQLFDRYPDSPNPLAEPAVVLVDEIDLHLHPHWQRTIIKYLSDIFPKTQFIVTTHSPFVIQSMDNVNLYTLQREEDHVNVKHWGCRSFIGWRIEEILSEVMGLGDDIQTNRYQELMGQFVSAINTNDYSKGKGAYDELVKIIHPQSVELEILKIQMSQLLP